MRKSDTTFLLDDWLSSSPFDFKTAREGAQRMTAGVRLTKRHKQAILAILASAIIRGEADRVRQREGRMRRRLADDM